MAQVSPLHKVNVNVTYKIRFYNTQKYCKTPLVIKLDKGKGKVHHRTGQEGPEKEQIYNSTLSLTTALGGDGWSTPFSGSFSPGKDQVSIV